MTETATASSGPLAKILTPSRASGLRTSGTTLASSLLAVIIALGISAVMLFITGKDPVTAFTILTDTAQNTDKLLEMMRRATPLIFSATAVAIGFKMNLFNIGVEGQYLFAALMAAEAGSHISLPGPLHVAAILAVALISGAAWAGISAFLKVRKNIHEVISTIMLNYIALSFIQWIFNSFFRDDSVEGLNIKTTIIEESGRLPDLVEGRLNSMFIIALVVVAIFWVVVYRSKFGFKLTVIVPLRRRRRPCCNAKRSRRNPRLRPKCYPNPTRVRRNHRCASRQKSSRRHRDRSIALWLPRLNICPTPACGRTELNRQGDAGHHRAHRRDRERSRSPKNEHQDR